MKRRCSGFRWIAYPFSVAAWVALGFVSPWPLSEAFNGFLRGVFKSLGSHALCSHENAILGTSAEYIFAGLLFLPLLFHALKPRRWLLILQVALVAIPICWWGLCFVAWISGSHP